MKKKLDKTADVVRKRLNAEMIGWVECVPSKLELFIAVGMGTEKYPFVVGKFTVDGVAEGGTISDRLSFETLHDAWVYFNKMVTDSCLFTPGTRTPKKRR